MRLQGSSFEPVARLLQVAPALPPCPRHKTRLQAVFRMRFFRLLPRLFILLFLLPLASHALWWQANDHAENWRNADWSSAGILLEAREIPEAQVIFMAARVGRWRGIFAEHCWVVLKEKNGNWQRFDVVGWGDPVRENHRAPDGRWYGHAPRIFARFTGAEAEAAIPKIRAAVATYPWTQAGQYRAWPGPNSNSFVRHVAAAVPEFQIVMPSTAVGRAMRSDGRWFGRTPSGDGYEVNLGGYAALSIGAKEGIEIDILSAVFGVDWLRPAIKLPGWGRIGPEVLSEG
jgi:hypothetical protein